MADDSGAAAAARKLAKDFLNNIKVDTTLLLDAPRILSAESDFWLGLRVWEKLSERRMIPPGRRVELAQKAALCAYKDPDVPARDGLDRALAILTHDCDLETSDDAETLGLAGAVYKRKWERGGRPLDLSHSFDHYRLSLVGRDGARHAVPTPEDLAWQRERVRGDQGYNAINAAFIGDVLAAVQESTGEEESAASHRAEASRIRELVRDVLDGEDLSQVPAKDRYWFVATQFEACFGLGDFERAQVCLAQIHEEDENKRVIPKPAPWMLQSTATQVAKLARYRFPDPEDDGARDPRPRAALLALLGGGADAQAVDSLILGKVGLALSGGGFRASLYHIGVLARLAELDVLRHVEVISTVSGGSIVGAEYFLLLKKRLEQPKALTQQDYVEVVLELARHFLAGVQTDVRCHLYGELPSRLAALFNPHDAISRPLAERFEQLFYNDHHAPAGKRIYLDELSIHPGGDTTFRFKDENWKRHAKVPALVINATSLNTGHVWQFTTTYAGESPYAIDDSIDTNDRLRRFYYRTKQHADPIESRRIALGTAVGASAGVPGLFPPTQLGQLYPGYDLRLVDGGVHDNQGVVSLLEQDCTQLIVSDACGQMTTDLTPSGVAVGPLLRSNGIFMERLRQEEHARVRALRDSGRIRGLLFVHLRQDLVGEDVEWVDCEDRRRPPERDDMLPYEVRREYQEALAAMRTDLDAFSDVEAHALMASGYRMTVSSFATALPEVARLSGAAQTVAWPFRDVEQLMGEHPRNDKRHDRFAHLLREGSKQLFRDSQEEEEQVHAYIAAKLRGLKRRLMLGAVALLLLLAAVGVWASVVLMLWTAVGLALSIVVALALIARRGVAVLRTALREAGLTDKKASVSAVAYAGVLLAAKHYSTFHLARYKDLCLRRGTVESLGRIPHPELSED